MTATTRATRNNDGVFTLRHGATERTFEVKGAMALVTFNIPGPNGVGYTTREVTREKAREMYRAALQGGFRPAHFCDGGGCGCGNELCEAEVAFSRKTYPKRPLLCASCITDTMEDEAERRWAESDI